MKTSYEAAWELLLVLSLKNCWSVFASNELRFQNLDLILKRRTKLTVWNKEVLSFKGLKFHKNEFGSVSRYTSVHSLQI